MRTILVSSILVVLLGVQPLTAAACAIDGIPSLIIGGVPAMHTTTMPSGQRLWAPFTAAQVFAPGEQIQLQEVQADLARTLPAVALATPFRWSFGDDTTTRGYVTSHRYSRPGRYQIIVYAYEQRARRWFAFDSALLQIVPANELAWDNLEYRTLRVVIALSRITWPLQIVLVLAVMAMLIRLHYRHATLRDARMDVRQDRPPPL